jgi:hypothetical protein
MSRISTKTVSHGATLLKQLVKKLDAKGNRDGKITTFERNKLQGLSGGSVEAILVVDHLRSSGTSRGTRKVEDLCKLVDDAKKNLAKLDRDRDGFVSDAELTKLPRTGGNLARALARFAVKHRDDTVSDFKVKP